MHSRLSEAAWLCAQSHSYHTYDTPGELVAQYLAYLRDVKARMQEPAYAINGAIYTEARQHCCSDCLGSACHGWVQMHADDVA